MSCKSRVVELTCKWWYVNMLPGSTVTLHRTGTSATTGKRPQSSGQLVFSFLKDVLGRGYAQTICLKGGYRKFFYSFSLGARLLVWASWLTSNKWTNKGILGVGSWSDGRVKEQLSRRTSSTGPVLGSGSYRVAVGANKSIWALPDLCTASNLIYKVRLPLPLPQREGSVCTQACQKNRGKFDGATPDSFSLTFRCTSMEAVAPRLAAKIGGWGTLTQWRETPALTLWPGSTNSISPSRTTSAPTTSQRRPSMRCSWTLCLSCSPVPPSPLSSHPAPWSTPSAGARSSWRTTCTPCWQTSRLTRLTSPGANTFQSRVIKVCQAHVTFVR